MKNKQRTKLAAAVATTIGVVATFTLFIGGVDKAGVPDPITVDGQTIEFTWTDENDKEDLIIWTDQERYSQGLSSAEVYVAVANMSGVEQDIELAGYFVNERRYIKDIEVLVEVEEIVPAEYETVCVESEIKQVKLKGDTASSTAEDLKCSEKITKKETTQMVNKWVELPSQQNDLFEVSKDLVKLAKSDKVRKSVDGYIAEKKSSEFSIKDREVLYYKLNIVYPAGDDGNFFLEAIGSEGGYGHLDPWFDTDWTKRVAITIDATKVPSTQTSFPVYVDLGELPAGFHTNVKSDGCDIRVVESDETTETAFELVDYDAGTDSGELHFMADSISGSTDTTFYIYYGNAGASCYATTATYGAENVWPSNYKLVAHDVGADSTSNGNDGTASAGVTIGGVTGQVGEATAFTVASNNVNFGEGAGDFDFGAGGFFVSTWLKRTRTGVIETALAKYSAGYPVSYFMRFATDDKIFVGSRSNSSRRQYYISSIAIDDTDWHKVDVFRSSAVSSWRIYIDGVDRTTLSSQDGAWNDNFENGEDFFAGQTSGGTETFIGSLDGMRVGIDMDGNWITTEYNNQSSVATFITVGAEEDNGGGSAPRRIININ